LKIQGTDGIRAAVSPASRYNGDPLSVFLDNGVMTEEFFELYCYSHVSGLIERGEMDEGDEVLIGWDSRDVDGFYTSRAVSGISKAGGRPGVLGAIPTPGVALSLFARDAAAAFMITASHNPYDQNGIKIFKAPDAMKMLTDDDDLLSKKVAEINYRDVAKAEKKYDETDLVGFGEKLFRDFHLDTANSWIADKGLFADSIIVLDTANGATANIAPEIFRHLGYAEIIQTAGEQNGRINEDSGVALLEGIKEISGERFATGAGLSGHMGVKALFSTAAKFKDELQSGEKRLFCVVFDGDGDRFFLLYFNPATVSVIVLSGDECAALMAEYLIKSQADRYRGSLFVHSVESDINVSRHAQGLGFKPVITAVGDKWVLKETRGSREFGIGCEETGHSIHGGYTLDRNGKESVFFAGNGVKGAINTLVAISELGRDLDNDRFTAMVREPFEPGFKRTAYSYYVNKQLFRRNSTVWAGVMEKIASAFGRHAPSGLELAEEPMDTEPDMLYLALRDETGSIAGSIFVRNSGTEDKIGISLRGPQSLESTLVKVSDEAVLFLMREMKAKGNPMAKAEGEVLKNIRDGLEVGEIERDGVNFHRLITEMEIKQKLITRGGAGYKLTGLGERYIG
jgi:phosphomannomutase